MDKYIYGGDTETIAGKPLSMQFYSEDVACDDMFFVGEKDAATTFLKWCAARKRNVQHVVYVHNLSFDLIEFLWGHHAKLVGPGGDFEFKVGKWNVRGVYGTPTFCTISNSHDITVMLVDSYSFFKGSLEKGAQLFCPDLPKLKRPAGLGEKKFTKRDTAFCEYAMRDSVVTYHMGRAIEAMHKEFDLQQCISVADMAARIFRHRFLSYTIPQPSREIIDAALLSYHGGKNNLTVPAGWYSNVTSLDISSAYPHAMRAMPAFSNEKLYRRFRATSNTKQVPEYGVYALRGTVADCAWPVIFSHGFKPLHGAIDGVYVQGFEVNEALRSGEFKPQSIRGWYYDAEKDLQAPALREFVDTFYKLKESTTDKIMREQYKLVLNSISGKFIQTRKRGSCAFTDIDADTTVNASELIAGGMFHPFIASAITAHTRARIHKLEHRYKAIHTATDGILTQAKNAKAEGKGIGALTLEASDATALILRNKCYVIYTAKGKKTTPSRVFKRKHIRKFALHGFQGSVSDLERMVATGRRKYEVNRPNRLKESLKKGLTPNEFVKRQYVLKIGAIPVE
jgi:hypothetical protein